MLGYRLSINRRLQIAVEIIHPVPRDGEMQFKILSISDIASERERTSVRISLPSTNRLPYGHTSWHSKRELLHADRPTESVRDGHLVGEFFVCDIVFWCELLVDVERQGGGDVQRITVDFLIHLAVSVRQGGHEVGINETVRLNSVLECNRFFGGECAGPFDQLRGTIGTARRHTRQYA